MSAKVKSTKALLLKEARNMAYKITDKYISCGACAANCPVECIKQGDERYIIDKDACIGCGTCARSLPS